MAVIAAAAERTRRGACMAMGLPCGRRTPAGRVRWYLLRVPEGREQDSCDRLLRLIPKDILDDAFVPQKERWIKRDGMWSLSAAPMYRGYAFALSRDAAGLAKALAGLSVPAELAGTEQRAWLPLADEAAAWFAQSMDARHVIRSSTAEIHDGVLRVLDGPLAGQEARISRIDRHRRRCLVSVGDADGGFTESMPIDVPHKS